MSEKRRCPRCGASDQGSAVPSKPLNLYVLIIGTEYSTECHGVFLSEEEAEEELLGFVREWWGTEFQSRIEEEPLPGDLDTRDGREYAINRYFEYVEREFYVIQAVDGPSREELLK